MIFFFYASMSSVVCWHFEFIVDSSFRAMFIVRYNQSNQYVDSIDTVNKHLYVGFEMGSTRQYTTSV